MFINFNKLRFTYIICYRHRCPDHGVGHRFVIFEYTVNPAVKVTSFRRNYFVFAFLLSNNCIFQPLFVTFITGSPLIKGNLGYRYMQVWLYVTFHFLVNCNFYMVFYLDMNVTAETRRAFCLPCSSILL